MYEEDEWSLSDSAGPAATMCQCVQRPWRARSVKQKGSEQLALLFLAYCSVLNQQRAARAAADRGKKTRARSTVISVISCQQGRYRAASSASPDGECCYRRNL